VCVCVSVFVISCQRACDFAGVVTAISGARQRKHGGGGEYIECTWWDGVGCIRPLTLVEVRRGALGSSRSSIERGWAGGGGGGRGLSGVLMSYDVW
jgi:hypothetical protein